LGLAGKYSRNHPGEDKRRGGGTAPTQGFQPLHPVLIPVNPAIKFLKPKVATTSGNLWLEEFELFCGHGVNAIPGSGGRILQVRLGAFQVDGDRPILWT